MSVDHSPREFPLRILPPGRALLGLNWWLRLRLRWASAGIDRLSHELAGEFATEDVTPMLQELDALLAERDALVGRIGVLH
jgi:hypothetical protein